MISYFQSKNFCRNENWENWEIGNKLHEINFFDLVCSKQDLTGPPAVTQIKWPQRISQSLTFYGSNERYIDQELKFQILANSAHYGQRNWPKTVLANFGHFEFHFAISQELFALEKQFLCQIKA